MTIRRILPALLLSFALLAFGSPPEHVHPEPAQQAQFVGSKSSNIYHRPSCSSARRIKDSNLVRFTSREDAARRGYRACKRCKP